MTTQPQNHIAPQPNVAIRPARPDDGPALAVVMAARGGTPSDHAPAAHWLLDRAPVLVVAEAALPELKARLIRPRPAPYRADLELPRTVALPDGRFAWLPVLAQPAAAAPHAGEPSGAEITVALTGDAEYAAGVIAAWAQRYLDLKHPAPPPGARAVIACRSGLRAWRAARILAATHPNQIALIATGETT